MTRDEEIITACKSFLSRYPSIDQAGLSIGFLDGAVWADKHPNLASLWHDSSEEPKGDNWKILCVDVYNGCWVESRVDAFLLHNKWDEYVGIESVKMWVYIDDLLPKSAWVL